MLYLTASLLAFISHISQGGTGEVGGKRGRMRDGMCVSDRQQDGRLALSAQCFAAFPSQIFKPSFVLSLRAPSSPRPLCYVPKGKSKTPRHQRGNPGKQALGGAN